MRKSIYAVAAAAVFMAVVIVVGKHFHEERIAEQAAAEQAPEAEPGAWLIEWLVPSAYAEPVVVGATAVVATAFAAQAVIDVRKWAARRRAERAAESHQRRQAAYDAAMADYERMVAAKRGEQLPAPSAMHDGVPMEELHALGPARHALLAREGWPATDTWWRLDAPSTMLEVEEADAG